VKSTVRVSSIATWAESIKPVVVSRGL